MRMPSKTSSAAPAAAGEAKLLRYVQSPVFHAATKDGSLQVELKYLGCAHHNELSTSWS